MTRLGFAVCLLGLSVFSHSVNAFSKNTECGVSVGCFDDCDGDCTFEVTWKEVGSKIEFTMKSALSVLASSGNWIAVALSGDKKMESDQVFDCIFDGTNYVIQRSVNSRYSNQVVSPRDSWITAKANDYSNGILTCSFDVDKNNPTVDFDTDYYLFFGKGKYISNFKSKHDKTPLISNIKADFQNYQNLSGESAQNIMLKLHGIMMICAWILCASIGVVIARYYKPVWLEQKLLGEKVWFTLHRSIMVFAVLFCIAGFTLIFVDRGTFQEVESDSDFKKAHPFIGLIVMCLAVIQPVMALVRPHPGDKNRFIFNWAHWAVGLIAHLLAVLNIVIGVLLDAMQMPLWVVYVVVAYAVYQIVIEMFLEFYDCIVRRKSPSENYEMREDHNLTKSRNDESKYTFKKIVLGIHICIIILFTTALIILIALDLSDVED